MKTLITMNAVFGKIPRMIRCALFIILCILFVPSSTTLAEEKETDQEALDAIDEEIKWLQSETYVITPSKIPETIKKTASSITVVTEKQIRQMGAKDLTDVIERVVPSFLNTNFIGDIFLTSRGQVQPRYLIMINNLPVYDADDQGYHYRNFYDFNIEGLLPSEWVIFRV
jgi:outer membrane receptor for ferrienterochelin and colicin